MAIRGVSLTLSYTAWNVSTNKPQVADSANHTLRWIKDGVSAAPANSPSDADPAAAPGECVLTLTAAEMSCEAGTLTGVSSTPNVVILPWKVTTENGAVANILIAALAESYAAKGSVPSLTQCLLEIRSRLMETQVAGSQIILRKVDGVTVAEVLGINDPVNPTNVTRSS